MSRIYLAYLPEGGIYIRTGGVTYLLLRARGRSPPGKDWPTHISRSGFSQTAPTYKRLLMRDPSPACGHSHAGLWSSGARGATPGPREPSTVRPCIGEVLLRPSWPDAHPPQCLPIESHVYGSVEVGKTSSPTPPVRRRIPLPERYLCGLGWCWGSWHDR